MSLTMIFQKFSNLIFVTSVYLIEYSVSQGDFLTEPWIDTVPVPAVTPAPIPLYSSDVVPVNNTFNRFVSFNENEVGTLVNTGSCLHLNAPPDTGTYTIGGALGLVQYRLSNVLFFFNLNLGRSGSILDGDSTPLEAVPRYYNTKYTAETASNYRDGWLCAVRRINVVKGAPPNPNFTGFAEKVRQVSEAGSHTPISGYDLNWFLPKQAIDTEYCYPGAYTLSNGVQTYTSTICLVMDNEIRTISQNQFYHAFSPMKDKSGRQYSNVKPLYKASPNTPIGGFGPIVVGYTPV